jgi:hypothetical protein
MGITGDNGSQGPMVVGICLAFAVLTFIVLSLRLFARIYVLGKMGVDDCEFAGNRFIKRNMLINCLVRPHHRSLCTKASL